MCTNQMPANDSNFLTLPETLEMICKTYLWFMDYKVIMVKTLAGKMST